MIADALARILYGPSAIVETVVVEERRIVYEADIFEAALHSRTASPPLMPTLRRADLFSRIAPKFRRDFTRCRPLAGRYSTIVSPEPPNSAGKSFSLGRPSRIGSTVSA